MIATKQACGEFPVGRSAAISGLDQLMRQVAGYDSTVLIRGESGCGKELVARRIHELVRARARAVRPGQLRRDSTRVARERAVRSRERCVHGRVDDAHRAFRARRRRHAVLGRDRRHERRHASEAAARPPGARLRACRQRRAASCQRPHSRGHSSRSRGARPHGRVPRGSVLQAQRVSDRRACRCASAATTCPR